VWVGKRDEVGEFVSSANTKFRGLLIRNEKSGSKHRDRGCANTVTPDLHSFSVTQTE